MIGVVGGGIAGLAAAYQLKQSGYSVRVFETNEELGGLVTSYETAGEPVEKFYHHLSATEDTIVELADSFGLDVEWRIGKNAYYVDGIIHPLDTPWEIAAFPPLSLYDKFRLGLLTLGIDVRGGIPAFDSYESLTEYDSVPVKEFVISHTTETVYYEFFDPLLSAKFGERKDDVSAAWLLGRIQFRSERDILRGEKLGYIRGGFQELTHALIDAVGKENIRTGTTVTDVHITDGAVESLEVTDSAGRGETVPVEGVIVAAMPSVLEDLTGYECGIDFQGTICAVLSMDSSLTDTYWLNIADEARFGVLIEHTNFIPPDRYGGEHLVYLASYIQDPSSSLWQKTDDEIQRHWLAGVSDLFPGFDEGEVNWVKIARNPQTAPVYECGYLDQVISHDLGNTIASGVYYAGMASREQYPERSLNGAIEAGFNAAEAVTHDGSRAE